MGLPYVGLATSETLGFASRWMPFGSPDYDYQIPENDSRKAFEYAFRHFIAAKKKGHHMVAFFLQNGAQKGTRTPTVLQPPAPEAGASTNFAIWALVVL